MNTKDDTMKNEQKHVLKAVQTHLSAIVLVAFIAANTICSTLSAQTSDLYKYSQGEIVFGSYILNEEETDVWGYFYLMDEGKIDDSEHEYSYVVLDNRLGLVASNKFRQKHISRRSPSFQKIEKSGDQLLLHYFILGNYSVDSRRRIINLAKNTIEEEQVFSSRGLSKVRESFDTYSDVQSNMGIPNSYTRSDSNFQIVYVVEKMKGFNGVSHLGFLAEGAEKFKWRTSLSRAFKSYDGHVDDMIVADDLIYLSTMDPLGPYYTDSYISAFTLDSGKQVYVRPLKEKKNNRTYTYRMLQEDKDVYVTGFYSEYHNHHRYLDIGVRRGLFCKRIDSLGEIIEDRMIPWTDMKEFIDIGEKGLIVQEDGGKKRKYFLQLLRCVKFDNGGFVIITEKATSESEYNERYTDDLVLFFLDEQFILQDVKTIDKQRSLNDNRDFEFAYYTDDRKGLQFFYTDARANDLKRQGKDMDDFVLGICKIQDGELTTKEISIMNEEFISVPIRAKEGHIIFRDYGKGEKNNMLRLEKLNE